MTGFRFGDFRLLPAARELWQGPQRLSLPPRAFDCLVYLVEHRDRAVGRDELIAAVWGRTEVSDAMVAQTILRIRRALGDDASAQETVRTVPRFGYRWVADTRETEAGPGHGAAGGGVPAAPAVLPAERHAGAEADAATRAPTGRHAPPVRWPVLALVATVVVLAALALWRESGRGTATTALPDAEPSAPLLVLPVLVEGSAGPPWIRLGAMDVIAEHLRRAGLAVAPSDLVVALADQWAPPGQPPDIGALFDASQARALVAPLLARTEAGWRMHLAWHERASAPVDYDAEGDGVIEAAVQAADRLLAGLGLAGGRTPPPTAADQLLAEAEAAMLSGRLAEAAALLEARPDGLAGDPALQLKLAQVRYRQGEWDRARDLIDSVLAAEPSDGLLHGRALIRQGGLLVRTAAIDEAAQAFEAALARLPERATGERGEAWNGLGVIATIRGELAAATEPLVRARALLLRSGDQLAYARTLINQGLLAMLQGQPHEGLEHYLEAEPLVLRYGAVDERVGLQVSMAFARMYLGQYATGERLAGEALALAGQTENPVVRRQAASIALRLAVLRGRGEAAARPPPPMRRRCARRPPMPAFRPPSTRPCWPKSTATGDRPPTRHAGRWTCPAWTGSSGRKPPACWPAPPARPATANSPARRWPRSTHCWNNRTVRAGSGSAPSSRARRPGWRATGTRQCGCWRRSGRRSRARACRSTASRWAPPWPACTWPGGSPRPLPRWPAALPPGWPRTGVSRRWRRRWPARTRAGAGRPATCTAGWPAAGRRCRPGDLRRRPPPASAGCPVQPGRTPAVARRVRRATTTGTGARRPPDGHRSGK